MLLNLLSLEWGGLEGGGLERRLTQSRDHGSLGEN